MYRIIYIAIKRFLNILRRFCVAIFLVVYVAIALFNYSVVQSFVAGFASEWFSQKTGGNLSVGSIYINPFGQVVIRDVRLTDPDGDKLADLGRLSVRFSGIPVSSSGLTLDAVMLSDTYYHFATVSEVSPDGDTSYLTNLEFIIAAFASESEDDDTATSPFVVDVKNLTLRNVHYKMDLADAYENPFPYGVDIAHMEYRKINGRFKNIKVISDDIVCRIVSFSAEEKSGFALRNLSADIAVSPYHIRALNLELNTDSTRFLADATLDYNGWDGMSEYCDSVYMTVTIKPGSVGGLSDACYWAPDIWGVDERIYIEGSVRGPVADMIAENMVASFGDETEICFDGRITGLPYIEHTTIDADISRLHTSAHDLYGVNHPDWVEGPYAQDIVSQLGSFDVAAEFHGDCQNWVAAVNIYSDVCNLSADAAVSFNERTHEYDYRADVSSNNIDISKIVANDWVSHTGLSISAQGSGFDFDHFRGTVDGELLNTVVRGNSIDNTTFSAQLANKIATVDIDLHDPLVGLSINGTLDLSDSIPGIGALVDIRNCNLTQLNFTGPTIYPTIFSARVDADLQGLDINAMVGSVSVSDLTMQINADELFLKRFDLALQRQRHNRKQMTISSDWLKADLSGYFDYTNLPLLFRQFCDSYIPQYYNPYLGESASDESGIANHFLNLDVRWIGQPHCLNPLVPGLGIAMGSSLHCSYNYMESFKVVMRSDSISFGSVCVHDLGVLGTPHADSYSLHLNSDHVSVGKVDFMQKMDLELDSRSQDAMIGLKWGRTPDSKNRGDIELHLVSDSAGNQISLIKPTFFLDGARWTFSAPEGARFDNHSLRLGRMRLTGNGQSVALDASIAHQYNDCVNISFKDFQLDGIMSLLVQDEALSMGGTLSGRGALYGINDSPYFNASLQVDEFTLGGQSLGLVDATASWNAELNQLNLALKTLLFREGGNSVPLSADGYVELGGDDPSVDFDIDLAEFDLGTIAPLASSFTSNLAGRVSGGISVEGSVGKPAIEGGLFVDHGQILIDVTGVQYQFTDSLHVLDNSVRFDHFVVSDSRANKAFVDGRVDCSDLSNITTDLSLHTDNLLVLDAATGDSFFGTLFVAADAKVTGPFTALDITGEVRTNPGSTVTVPINDRRVVSSQDYITFVSDQLTTQGSLVKMESESSSLPIKIRAGIHVTPDLKLAIPMDFMSQMFVSVGASGEGDLLFELVDNNPLVTGAYEISSGSLALNLAQLVSRKFVIESGSMLVFPGNISDTRFDINAVYSLRTNVSSLTGGLSADEVSQKTVTVEDVFMLSGTMDRPQVSFDIRLPNADQSVQEEVFAFIDRTNERDMLNQTVSLLVLGQFSNASNASAAEGSTPNGYQAMVNTMGSIVSSMVSFVDLNFDYHAATELTTEQFELDISKEWNRFFFESSFGYGGDSRNFIENTGYNSVVGDMLVGYKLSPRVHLFMFNRTNTNDYTRTDLPYRQGMGLKFTRDFDRWSDLIRFKKKSSKPATSEQ